MQEGALPLAAHLRQAVDTSGVGSTRGVPLEAANTVVQRCMRRSAPPLLLDHHL